MRRIVVLLMMTALAVNVTYASTGIEERIERVENGLVPSVVIKDGPTWTIEERMKQYGVPGLAIAVIDDFEIAWTKGYGVIEAGTDQAVTNETLFQAASISKPLGATLALHLVDKGRIELDRDINEILSSWKIPENEFTQEEKVTLRRILSHTAGLTVHGFRGYDVAGGEKVPTIRQVLDGVEPANSDPIRVDIVPGTRFRYSGGGYTVMQLLIEDVTGRPLFELANEVIFHPLGMVSSSFEKPLPADFAARTSAGHLDDGSSIEGYWFLPNGSTCCGLWTTPADLAKFAIELQRSYRGESNKILSKDITREMLTPQDNANFGLGMGFIGEKDVLFSHSGGNVGFRCILLAHRDKGYGLTIMSNSDNLGSLYHEILRSAAREYGWGGIVPKEYESIEDVISTYRQRRDENPDDASISEYNINILGYEMMWAGNHDAAVALLSLNAEFYPQSANCYDSLAEAHLASGDRDNALKFYKKALEILDQYPEANTSNQRLRETIPRHLQKLQEN
jgi:CubicO group peptidase (beta-lactamase class C family)